MKDILTEYNKINLKFIIKENIDKIICEELGVSSDVINVSNNLCNQISEYVNQGIYQTERCGDSYKTEGDLMARFMGYNLQIHFTYYDFENIRIFRKWIEDKYFLFNNSKSTKSLINVVIVNPNYSKSFSTAIIAHELLHFFQKNKSDKLNKNNYNIAKCYLLDEDYELSSIALLLYLYPHTEQESYAHEIYIQMSGITYSENNNETMRIEELKRLQNCDGFIKLTDLIHFGEYLKNNKISDKKLKIFKIKNNNQLLKIYNNVYTSYLRKISRARTLARENAMKRCFNIPKKKKLFQNESFFENENIII